jgi:DNA-binding MarR family transcriptional regulator
MTRSRSGTDRDGDTGVELNEGGELFAAEMTSRIGTFLKRAEQALVAEKTRVLRPFHLTIAQYAAMLALHYVPGQSAAQLSRTAAVTPQTMAMILANLESKKLVRRVISTIHSKVMVTTLTDVGEELVMRADVEARAVERRLRRAFTADETEMLTSLLERSIATLSSGASAVDGE